MFTSLIQAQTPNRMIDEYLQVDLLKLTDITAIATQVN